MVIRRENRKKNETKHILLLTKSFLGMEKLSWNGKVVLEWKRFLGTEKQWVQ